MMIRIIINGTARELTNNGEQMIPSWPQKKKKRSVRLQKIKQILSWQFQTQMPQLESVSGFTFSLWRAKSIKDQPLPVPAMPYEAKEGPQPSLGLKFSCSSHVQIVPPATLSSFIFFYRFLNYVNKV